MVVLLFFTKKNKQNDIYIIRYGNSKDKSAFGSI